MKFPDNTVNITVADWRAQVEKDLAGVPFDKALVYRSPENMAIQPLYTDGPKTAPPGAPPYTRGSSAEPKRFGICMPHEALEAEARLSEDLEGGADALWLRVDTDELPDLLGRMDLRAIRLLLDAGGAAAMPSLIAAAAKQSVPLGELRFALCADPLGMTAGGQGPLRPLATSLKELGHAAHLVSQLAPLASSVLVSTLPYHAAGADSVDELAVALATGATYLDALLEAGFSAADAARQIAVQISVGRDTFGELCKLRALRLCWHKLFAAAGAPTSPLPLLHAVSSLRTLTERDPWVNMLRVTTQVFAAALGGADLVTPAAYDELLGTSPLGRRVARNTGLILRDESHLGRVLDAAGGSYYLETLTDELARKAWSRFQTLQSRGGLIETLLDGTLRKEIAASAEKRRELVAKRKEAVVGVSEFANLANLGEPRRKPPVRFVEDPIPPALPIHRDAEPFEALRDRAEPLGSDGTVSLSLLGPPAEYRARVGFAVGFFAAAGLVAKTDAAHAQVTCICGSDERYAAEAAARARELKAAGLQRVLVAGRPGALEATLREAGVDDFIFVGCDAVTVLSSVLSSIRTLS